MPTYVAAVGGFIEMVLENLTAIKTVVNPFSMASHQSFRDVLCSPLVLSCRCFALVPVQVAGLHVCCRGLHQPQYGGQHVLNVTEPLLHPL